MRYVRRSFAALPQRVRAARVASTVFMPPRPPEKRRPHPSPGPAAGRAVGALARPESSGICSITMTLDSWTASPARTGAPPGSRATGQPYAPYRGVFNAEPSPAARMRIRTPTARRFARRRKAAERRPLPKVRGRKLLASRLIAEAASRSRGGKAIMPGPTALPLGIGHLSSRRPDVHEEDMHAGDRILAYTDGITDARSPDEPVHAEPLRLRRCAAWCAPSWRTRVTNSRTTPRRCSSSGDRREARSPTSLLSPPPARESPTVDPSDLRAETDPSHSSRANAVSIPSTIGSARRTQSQSAPWASRCQTMRYCRASWLTW